MQDPNNNRIGQWLDVAPQEGIADLYFQLAAESPLGTYIISVAKEKAHSSFSVEEYGTTGEKDSHRAGVILSGGDRSHLGRGTASWYGTSPVDGWGITFSPWKQSPLTRKGIKSGLI